MQSITELVAEAAHIVLIVHINPDADSLGSASAFYTYLMRLEKRVSLFCASGEAGPKLAFLPWSDKMRAHMPSSSDLAISFDCGSAARLGAAVSCPLLNIDHHMGNERYGDYNMVEPDAISTTQVLWRFFNAEGIKINAKMATALYAGLLDDSGAFLSSRTDTETFAMAQALLESGADAQRCSQRLFHTMSLAALRLKGRMLQQLQLHCAGKVAVMNVSRELMEETGAKGSDCEEALHEAISLATVTHAVMLLERRDGSCKVSLRGDGSVDLSGVAAGFGGGGHRHSAGFESQKRPEELSEAILSILNEELF